MARMLGRLVEVGCEWIISSAAEEGWDRCSSEADAPSFRREAGPYQRSVHLSTSPLPTPLFRHCASSGDSGVGWDSLEGSW